MLLDRKVSATLAIKTSVKVFTQNPKTMLMWGMIVTAGLVLGSIPFFRRPRRDDARPWPRNMAFISAGREVATVVNIPAVDADSR